MFNRRNKIEVVSPENYTEYVEPITKGGYADKKTFAAALIPIVAAVPLVVNVFKTETYAATTIPVSTPAIMATIPPPIQTPSIPVAQTLQQMPPVVAEPAGVIADTSLEMLANVLDPLLQLMVAVSFPIASVIMVGACFFFMFGNSEKAWDMIGKAAMGYVIIQLSPLFLEILRKVGESVA